MTILVTGGTGQLGRELVPLLRSRGSSVRITSRGLAPPDVPPGEWARVDWNEASTVAAALAGVTTVIHTASGSPAGERTTATALLRAIRFLPKAPHLVYISIVGVDEIPMAYYRSKHHVEQAFSRSSVPFTLLRATQFHSLLAQLLAGLARLPVMLLPRGVRFQPVAISVVAERLADLAAGSPQGRVADLGGPEVRSLSQLAQSYLRAKGRRKRIQEVALPGRFLAALRAGKNLVPDSPESGPTFEDYLADLARFAVN
jgi:uncharacterized protein YbjT (DUF2867 family)